MTPTLKPVDFDWDKSNRTLTADISELRLDGFPSQLFIKSDKFDFLIMFEAFETKKDTDHDVKYVSYKPIQSLTAFSDIRIIIFND